MAEQKYAKYVLELKEVPIFPSWVGRMARPFMVDGKDLRGLPIHVGAYIYYSPGAGFGYGDVATLDTPAGPKQDKSMPHVHPKMDEVFFYFGTDPHNPSDLGGEHELWIGKGEEAEKYLITKTTCVFFPKGVPHGPEVCRRVDRPYFQVIVALASDLDGMMEKHDVVPLGWSIDSFLQELARK